MVQVVSWGVVSFLYFNIECVLDNCRTFSKYLSEILLLPVYRIVCLVSMFLFFLGFLFVFILCPVLHVSQDCSLLVAASVFSNVFICCRQFLPWYFSLVGICFMYHLKWMGVWAWFSLFFFFLSIVVYYSR